MAALLFSACAGSGAAPDGSGLPTSRPVTVADLRAKPQSGLFFPGSVVLRRVGASQSATRPGEEPDAAFTGAILRASTTAPNLYAWYRAQLLAAGFGPAPYYLTSDQTSGQAWQFHRRLQVQIAVFDPVTLQADRGIDPHLDPGQIAYEALLVGYAPGLPKE